MVLARWSYIRTISTNQTHPELRSEDTGVVYGHDVPHHERVRPDRRRYRGDDAHCRSRPATHHDMELEDGKPDTSSPCSSYAPVSLGLCPLTCDVTVDVCRVFLQEQYPVF